MRALANIRSKVIEGLFFASRISAWQ